MHLSTDETSPILRGTISHVKACAPASLLVILLSACSSQPQPAAPNSSFTGHEIVLEERESVTLGGAVTVRFVRVAEDSRCAARAQCVWAGNAAVVLAVSATTDSVLHTNPQSGPRELTSGAIRIGLFAVEPELIEPGPPPTPYRIRLRWGFLPD